MKHGLAPHIVAQINRVFSRHPHVEKAVLYGSRAMGTFRRGSDIDLALVGKALDLTEQFKIENEIDDLLLPYKMDVAILSEIQNPDLIAHIERVGVLFYDSEATLRTT